MIVPINNIQVNINILNKNGKVVTDSKAVSDVFGKEHSGNGGIVSIIEKMPEGFRVGNFTESKYQSQNGHFYKCYDMTRDGMSMLIMGFTGKKAFEWKEKFIEAFNMMEEKLIDNTPTLQHHKEILMALNNAQQMALNNAQQATMEVVQKHEDRLNYIENTRRLEAYQEYNLVREKNKKVYEIAGDDKAFANKLHRKVWQLFKKKFSLPRYAELPAVKYDQGIEFVRSLTLADMVN